MQTMNFDILGARDSLGLLSIKLALQKTLLGGIWKCDFLGMRENYTCTSKGRGCNVLSSVTLKCHSQVSLSSLVSLSNVTPKCHSNVTVTLWYHSQSTSI